MEQNWEMNMLSSIAISFPLLNSVLSNVGETFFCEYGVVMTTRHYYTLFLGNSSKHKIPGKS